MSRGSSLVELLVGVACVGVFALAVHQSCAALLRGVRVLEAASEAQEAARLGVQLIVADAREAGFSPLGPLADGIREAERGALAIARDLNGDGDVDDSNEAVSYRYAPERRALLRAQGDAPPQPLLDGLDADGLAFTFLDAGGAPLPAGSALAAADRARIRRVAVRLAISLRNPIPGALPLRAEQTATVTLRNPAP